MKTLFLKDKKRRILFQKAEKKRLVLKKIFSDLTLPKNLRMRAYYQLKTLPRDSSITRVRNRCLLTNRSRSIYRKFRLSRLTFRRLALNGELIGVRKSSW